MSILGIDFGNKNTKIFKIENNNFHIILNKESNRKFQNIVAIKEKRFFDQEAYNFLCSNNQTLYF